MILKESSTHAQLDQEAQDTHVTKSSVRWPFEKSAYSPTRRNIRKREEKRSNAFCSHISLSISSFLPSIPTAKISSTPACYLFSSYLLIKTEKSQNIELNAKDLFSPTPRLLPLQARNRVVHKRCHQRSLQKALTYKEATAGVNTSRKEHNGKSILASGHRNLLSRPSSPKK